MLPPLRSAAMSPTAEKNRLEAFSDGVFAIAITLLILEIRIPHGGEHGKMTDRALLHALLAAWPSFLAFLTSFATILIIWINHHGLFTMLRRVDRSVMLYNGLLLLAVTFVPFPTALLAEHLADEAARTAAVVYCGTFVVVSIGYNLLLRAVACEHLTHEHVKPPLIRRVRRAYWTGFLTYSAATVVALFAPLAATLMCSVLWILWTWLNYGDKGEHLK